jgi:SAM-dependent methyltransferase
MSDQTTPVTAPASVGTEPDYGEAYYVNYWGGGGPYERNERWLKFFGEVADGIIRDFHPATALDAGCAMGFLVEALRERGVDASGVDVSEYAISQVHESIRDHTGVASLTDPLPRRYDLITCVEVLEHLPPIDTDRAIANLCQASDMLLISSTPEDFGEPTHLNVLPPEAWSAKLAQHGFIRDLKHDLSYISPWAALYCRREEPVEEIVRSYDRAWYRLRREVAEVRKSLLETQDRIADLEADGGVELRPGLLDELDKSNAEILRLRDLLIGKDVELGAAQGRVAELNDRWERVTNAAARIPGFGTLKRIARRRG